MKGIEFLLESIGWALLQSTWQVFILTIVLWVILRFNMSSSLKYAIAYLFMLLSFGSFLYAFNNHFMSDFVWNGFLETSEQTGTLGGLREVIAFGVENVMIANRNVTTFFGSLIINYEKTIASTWIIGFTIFLFRYSISFWISRKIKSSGVDRVPAYWLSRFDVLKSQLKISRNITFRISDQISGPITIGFLKPIILFPAAVFTQLSPYEIETIILHELAHIKRGDYFHNGIQVFIKCIFFFHPGIYYMRNILIREREFSSDDQVLFISRDPDNYVLALGKLQLNSFYHQNSFVMHAHSNSSDFIKRINRILIPTHQISRPGLLCNILPFLALLIGTTMVSASFQNQVEENQDVHKSLSVLFPMDINADINVPLDTVPNEIKSKEAQIKLEFETQQRLLERMAKEVKQKEKMEQAKVEQELAMLKKLEMESEAKNEKLQRKKMELELAHARQKSELNAKQLKLELEKAHANMLLEQSVKESMQHRKIKDIGEFKKDLFKILLAQKLVSSEKEEITISLENKNYFLNGKMISRDQSEVLHELFSRNGVFLEGDKKVYANTKVINIGVGTIKDKSYTGHWDLKK